MRKYSCRIMCLLSGLILFCAGCSEDTVSKTNAADQGNEQDQACECSTGEHCSASELEDCHRQKPTDGGGQLPDNCPDGDCEHLEQRCPDACPDTCEDDGECPAVVCPESCPGHCDSSGECLIENVCPAECPDSCDEDGICPQETACPAECPDSCDEEGICPQEIVCPPECLDSCGEDGTCPSIPECPENCQNGCDADGVCLCSPSCKSTCDADGVCQCPASCKSTCNDDGVCLCPASCKSTCNDDGVCMCPESCKSTCSSDGVCQCPASCPKTCSENGECPVLCGNETVKKMYFTYNELDILVPNASGRTSANMTVYIKTDKKTYNMDNAPCKAEIQLSVEDKSIVKVVQNSQSPKNATFTAVAAGTTTCTVKLKGQPGMTGKIKVHVLNPDRLNGNIAENKSGSYVHKYKNVTALLTGSRASQGFDFYSDKFMYFAQLSAKKQKTANEKTEYNRELMNIFQNDFSKNSAPMVFHAAGHGQNLNVEHIGDIDYVWFANYGKLICTSDSSCIDGYKESQTISRIEWQGGKTYYPSDVKEHYYYSDPKKKSYYYSFEPALDSKNNMFAFRARYAGDGNIYVNLYHLNKVKGIQKTSKVKLPHGITWINQKNELKKDYKPTVEVKELSSLEPTNHFSKKKIAVQGLEIENGIIYTVAGMPKLLSPYKENNKYLYKSEIPIYIYTYAGKTLGGKNAKTDESQKNGKEYVYYLKTSSSKSEKIKYYYKNNVENKVQEYTGYFLNNAELDDMVNYKDENGVLMEHNGYFEPEGIRVSDGKLFLNMTVQFRDKEHKNKKFSRQVIFVYDLAK